MANAVYVGRRPKEWGPIGTLIMIRPKAPTAKQPQTPEDKTNAKSSATATPLTPEPVATNPAAATDTNQAK